MVAEQKRDEALLRSRLQLLANYELLVGWAQSITPIKDLEVECADLAQDAHHSVAIRNYLIDNPIIQETVDTMLATLAMISNTRWQETPDVVKSLARRGWYLGRWLPTFLIIDGPLGSFIKSAHSPMKAILRTEYARFPLLSEIRRAFNSDFFRSIRNGVGHWSFRWEHDALEPRIAVIDSESGKQTIQITLQEGEALHLATLSAIDVLENKVFAFLNPIRSS